MDIYEQFIKDYKEAGNNITKERDGFLMTELVDWIMKYIEEEPFKDEIADCFVKAKFNPHGTHALALCKGDSKLLAKKLNVNEGDLFEKKMINGKLVDYT